MSDEASKLASSEARNFEPRRRSGSNLGRPNELASLEFDDLTQSNSLSLSLSLSKLRIASL